MTKISSAQMKCDSFAEAVRIALQINVPDDALDAKLVPVGRWILGDRVLLEEISAWRQKSRYFFLDQRESTPAKTFDYFAEVSIPSSDRIFFIIYVSNMAVGHIGLSSIDENKAELDNLMRGRSGGPPDLMLHVERKLVRWAIDSFELTEIKLRMLSKNPFAQAIHQELGFVETARMPLRNVSPGAEIHFQVCESGEETTKIQLIEMTLKAQACIYCS